MTSVDLSAEVWRIDHGGEVWSTVVACRAAVVYGGETVGLVRATVGGFEDETAEDNDGNSRHYEDEKDPNYDSDGDVCSGRGIPSSSGLLCEIITK